MNKKYYIGIFLLLGVAAAYFIGRSYGVYEPENKHDQSTIRALKRKPIKLPKIDLPKLSYSMPAQNEIDEVTQKLVGLDEGLSISERNDIVWNLRNRNLSQQDFRAFYTFLKTNPSQDGPQLAWHSLKNDLLVFVIEDGRFKESTAQLMIDIINDPEQHEVMREYTLQYITDFFERHWVNKSPAREIELKELSTTDKQLQDTFLKSMWNLLDSTEGPIAGTSLIRLNDLSNYLETISQSKLDREIERMAFEETVPVSSRMAALSVASERGMAHLQKQLKDLTFDQSTTLSLRMAALHSVSTMDPDKDFIDRLSKEIINNQNANRLLKRAAELALKKLNKLRG